MIPRSSHWHLKSMWNQGRQLSVDKCLRVNAIQWKNCWDRAAISGVGMRTPTLSCSCFSEHWWEMWGLEWWLVRRWCHFPLYNWKWCHCTDRCSSSHPKFYSFTIEFLVNARVSSNMARNDIIMSPNTIAWVTALRSLPRYCQLRIGNPIEKRTGRDHKDSWNSFEQQHPENKSQMGGMP